MNEVSLLARGEAPSTEPAIDSAALPARRRKPAVAAKLLLPVWGYSYVRQFLEWSLPTLLAPGNIPAIAQMLPTEFVILTSADDEAYLREHASFKRLATVCPVNIQVIDHLITDGNYSTTITLAYAEAVRALGEAMVDTCFFFLVSDYIMADGSLANVFKRMQRGASAIVVGNFQVAREEALPWLQEKLRAARPAVSLQSRQLMKWALNHLHPATLANTVNIPFSHNSHTNRLFWRIDGDTVLGRFYLMHMLCIRPEVTDFVIGSSCDYSFVPEMCPSGNVDVITDSDEYLVIEMQPRGHEALFLRQGPLQPRILAKSLSEWTTEIHRANVKQSVLFHASALPPEVRQSIQQADGFIAEVNRYIRRDPAPYRNHPYWRGATAAFKEALGHRLEKEELPYIMGLPGGSEWLTHRLFWRAKYALMGQAPYVLPWHPSWPDYRIVLQELQPFFNDPKLRLLMVSNEPTAFSVALADSGERVQRLRGTPLLQSRPGRYDALRGKFDLCLLELSELDLRNSDQIIDRIVPLMKHGAKLIVFVRNLRPLESANGFSTEVSYQAARFIRPGTLPTQIQFVPASRFRWMVLRGIGLLWSIAKFGSWLGAAVGAIGTGGILCLSFIGNLDVLRRTRQGGRRGLASSMVVELSVDPSKLSESVVTLGEARRKAARTPLQDLSLGGAAIDQTREPQYNRCIQLRDSIGLTTLGLMTNQVWYDDPRRLTFLLARYKFVAKMLSGLHNVAEVGCGDAFGTRVVLQEVPDVTVYDFDPVFIEDVRTRQDERWPIKAQVHDVVAGPLPRKHEGLFSLDVLEHILPEDEHTFLMNLCSSLVPDGVLIIGTPSIESQAYASPPSKAGHVNCKTGNELKALLENYFRHVFVFSMNDEMVHTGFFPMAHYLFALCMGPSFGAGRAASQLGDVSMRFEILQAARGAGFCVRALQSGREPQIIEGFPDLAAAARWIGSQPN